jgi:nitroreductase
LYFDLIRKRRSIRKFTAQPLEKDKIDALIEAALRAPTSRGSNPWEFIVVDSPQTLGKLAEAKPHGSSFVENAALAIVVCADMERSDVWVEDASIAATYIQLAAEDLGIGSCWVQIRKRMHANQRSARDYIVELLKIPQPLTVECIVALGYPAEKKPSHGQEDLQYQKIHLNMHGRPYGK